MSKEIANRIVGVAVVALGMAGLYFKVEYSGWVLLLGGIVVMNSAGA